jgi:hypothetical protein
VGAILASRCVGVDGGEPMLIATYAWERLRVDPEPGPRAPQGFSQLGLVGDCHIEVLSESDTLPPGRSTLPRLARDTGARLFVLDAGRGAVGMRATLTALIDELAVERVVVVDVGGDAIARGTEPELLSPLADALMLAACRNLPVSVEVVVVGPGADGELPESTVLGYLTETGAVRVGMLTGADVGGLATTLRWHPTEATAVAAAAALGVRGVVELRRESVSTAVTEHSAEVWACDIDAVARHNCLVVPLTHTSSLEEAETVLGQWTVS